MPRPYNRRVPRPETRSNPTPEVLFDKGSRRLTLCIFMESGHTFTFKNVQIQTDNENVLVFDYIAMSDGHAKVAVFSKFRIVGFSTH